MNDGTKEQSPQDEQYPQAAKVCAEAYQVVGSLLIDVGAFHTDEGEKILDNLSQHRLVHDDVLPWPSFKDDDFTERYTLLLHDLREFVTGLREVGLKDDGNALEEIVNEAPPLRNNT